MYQESCLVQVTQLGHFHFLSISTVVMNPPPKAQQQPSSPFVPRVVRTRSPSLVPELPPCISCIWVSRVVTWPCLTWYVTLGDNELEIRANNCFDCSPVMRGEGGGSSRMSCNQSDFIRGLLFFLDKRNISRASWRLWVSTWYPCSPLGWPCMPFSAPRRLPPRSQLLS